MKTRLFEQFAERAASAAGSKYTFFGACLLILAWGTSGPYFNFSDTWQLVINTSTTIITFLMVFLIQNSQNREMKALNVKMDEQIRSGPSRNALIGLEKKAEAEIERVAEEVAQDVSGAAK